MFRNNDIFIIVVYLPKIKSIDLCKMFGLIVFGETKIVIVNRLNKMYVYFILFS